MATSTLLVTGASGKLGRRIVELLLEAKAGPIVATTRTPESLKDLAARGVDVRRADFDDPASLAVAFVGVERAVLVSTDAVERPGRRVEQHRKAIDAFVAAGVKHVVYTSLPNAAGSTISIAADHAATEAALAASGLDFTVLRNTMYSDMLFMSLPAALASGQLVDARADGRVAFVSREDCARIAAVVIADRALQGRTTLDVTGPALVTSAELAALVTDVLGRPVVHVPVSGPALLEGLVGHGLPRPIAEILVSFDEGIAKGELSVLSASVLELTGRAPQSVREFLVENRAALTAPPADGATH